MSVLGLNKGKTLITGSEDTTFKVLQINGQDINVTQSFSVHEASVRAFAKIKVPENMRVGFLKNSSHVVVSAGSKMQAHAFALTSGGALAHICRYNQELFRR